MFGFSRIACAVPNTHIADVKQNKIEIENLLEECFAEKADFALFPELCITSYTCGDLLLRRPLLEETYNALQDIICLSKKKDTVIIIGAPFEQNGMLFNCAFIIYNGELCGIIPKTYLPSYDEFSENRWFSPANYIKTDTATFFGKDVPFGASLVFNIEGKAKFSAEICEDIWAPIPPSTKAALSGAEIIFNLSASNELVDKRKYRVDMINHQSSTCICTYAYASAGACESTTDLMFSGHSIVSENGTIIAQNNKNIDSGYVIFADTDIEKLKSIRNKFKTFADCAYLNTDYTKIINIPSLAKNDCDGKHINVPQSAFIPEDKNLLAQHCECIFDIQVNALAQRLIKTKLIPVIGVSGGLDSTLALLVSVKAAQKAGLTNKDCIAVTMPCFGTTDRTYTNSLKLMQALGVTSKTIQISNSVISHFNDIGHDQNTHDLTYENAQARERTQVLMDIAGMNKGLVVGTGDLSELALGWCTFNADHMSMYSVNAGIPKTLIPHIIEHISGKDEFSSLKDILADIINTPISPELLPPEKDGNIAQKTQDLVGPYILHDFFLFYTVKYGFSKEKILFLAKKAFENQFDQKTIEKWLNTFLTRFKTQQFKRNCQPDGVKVGTICLSPRGDWKMPSDTSFL